MNITYELLNDCFFQTKYDYSLLLLLEKVGFLLRLAGGLLLSLLQCADNEVPVVRNLHACAPTVQLDRTSTLGVVICLSDQKPSGC